MDTARDGSAPHRRQGRYLQVEQVQPVRHRVRHVGEFGDERLATRCLRRVVGTRGQSPVFAMRREPATVVGAVEARQVDHERGDPALDQPPHGFGQEIRRRAW